VALVKSAPILGDQQIFMQPSVALMSMQVIITLFI